MPRYFNLIISCSNCSNSNPSFAKRVLLQNLSQINHIYIYIHTHTHTHSHILNINMSRSSLLTFLVLLISIVNIMIIMNSLPSMSQASRSGLTADVSVTIPDLLRAAGTRRLLLASAAESAGSRQFLRASKADTGSSSAFKSSKLSSDLPNNNDCGIAGDGAGGPRLSTSTTTRTPSCLWPRNTRTRGRLKINKCNAIYMYGLLMKYYQLRISILLLINQPLY